MYQRVGTSGLVMVLPFLEQEVLYESFAFTDGPWSYNDTWIAPNAEAIGTIVPAFRCPSDNSPRFSEDPAIGSAYSTDGTPAATGSYALSTGSLGPPLGGSPSIKYENNGVFYYLEAHQPRDIRDGLSHTMFAGEVIEGHTKQSSNIWSRAVRMMDCQRSTKNALNTPPGEPLAESGYGFDVNAAFASEHPGGAHFAFGDGHVDFLGENIDLQTYRGLSTREGGELSQ
jgi:prepilin-type processing-associated H-X9-DG protein